MRKRHRAPTESPTESPTRREFLAGVSGAVASTALPTSAPAFAALVASPIACGRLSGLDTAAAEKLADVLSIVRLKSDDRIDYLGEPLALVIASRKEAAEAAARRCALFFESQPAVLTTSAALSSAYIPSAAVSEERGDAEAVIASLQIQAGAAVGILRQTYRTAPEPPLPGSPSPRAAALIARAERTVGRPVSLLLSPAQTQALAASRPETIQTLTLCAGRDGRLRAIVSNLLNETAMRDEYIEPCAVVSRHLYHADSLRLTHKLVRKNIAPRGVSGIVAPGTLPGLFALESAIDELAHLLRFDPLRLRRLNYAELDEASQNPWSEKRLRECYRIGEAEIAWTDRKLETRANRDGEKLIGLGMASTMGPPRLVGGAMAALFGAHFSRVVVDAQSGAIRRARHVTVIDAGAAPSKDLLEAAKAGVAYALKTLFAGEASSDRISAADVLVSLLDSEAGPEFGSAVGADKIAWTAQAVRDVAAAGVAAAVTSALYNATGVRYRELPIAPLQMIG